MLLVSPNIGLTNEHQISLKKIYLFCSIQNADFTKQETCDVYLHSEGIRSEGWFFWSSRSLDFTSVVFVMIIEQSHGFAYDTLPRTVQYIITTQYGYHSFIYVVVLYFRRCDVVAEN